MLFVGDFNMGGGLEQGGFGVVEICICSFFGQFFFGFFFGCMGFLDVDFFWMFSCVGQEDDFLFVGYEEVVVV